MCGMKLCGCDPTGVIGRELCDAVGPGVTGGSELCDAVPPGWTPGVGLYGAIGTYGCGACVDAIGPGDDWTADMELWDAVGGMYASRADACDSCTGGIEFCDAVGCMYASGEDPPAWAAHMGSGDSWTGGAEFCEALGDT